MLTLSLSPLLSAASETHFSAGMVLYNKNNWIDSHSPLRLAAQSGDRDAQYYLAEALRLANRYMTDESIHWYIAAAEQGDLFAMLRLSRSDDPCIEQNCEKDSEYWEERANAAARKQAANNDGAAMHALYFLTGDRNWLKKAADAGDSEASYFLARLMLSDTMDKNTGRTTLNEEARKYLEKSAIGGNPHAMDLFRQYYLKKETTTNPKHG